MRFSLRPLVATIATCCLLALPGPAAAQGTTDPQSRPADAVHPAAYYCRGESKRHVRGQKRTPFSQCVSAMVKLRNGSATSAAGACRALSRRHANGMKRTPYAVCVAGAKRLLAERPV